MAAAALKRMTSPRRTMTQKQIAEKCGVTQQAVSAWLKGQGKPEPDRQEKIEKHFGVPVEHWTRASDESGQLPAADAEPLPDTG